MRVEIFLKDLNTKIQNPKPLLQILGNDFLNIALDSFESQKSPEGKKWKSLKDSTIKKSFKGKIKTKKGKLTTGYIRYASNRKILTDSGSLRQSLTYKAGNHDLLIGSFLPYANIHQFGGHAGKGHQVKIPKRPFFPVNSKGLDSKGKAMVEKRVKEYLKKGLK